MKYTQDVPDGKSLCGCEIQGERVICLDRYRGKIELAGCAPIRNRHLEIGQLSIICDIEGNLGVTSLPMARFWLGRLSSTKKRAGGSRKDYSQQGAKDWFHFGLHKWVARKYPSHTLTKIIRPPIVYYNHSPIF